MSQTESLEPTALELESKDYWLRRFRKAKTLKTLELMVPKAVSQYHQQAPVLAAIYLAECQRERELGAVFCSIAEWGGDLVACGART